MSSNNRRGIPLKVLAALAVACFVVAIPVFLISTTISVELNSPRLYEYDFDTYNIPAITGLDKAELMKVAHGLIAYYNSADEFIQTRVIKNGVEIDFYKDREIAHMKDVKDLIRFDYSVQQVSMLYIIAFVFGLVLWDRARFWPNLRRGLKIGALATIGLILVVAVWSAVGFDSLFLSFHLVSFSNSLWILDPRTDYLLMMLPEDFFRDAFIFGGIAILIEAAVIFGLTVLADRFYRRRTAG